MQKHINFPKSEGTFLNVGGNIKFPEIGGKCSSVIAIEFTYLGFYFILIVNQSQVITKIKNCRDYPQLPLNDEKY